jgi:TonB-linked SusC/RagA family outer membrane protein
MKKKLIYILLSGMLLVCHSILAQDSGGGIIRGKMVSDSGEELISASIVEIDKNERILTGTQTDVNGDFSMKIRSANNRLRFSYLGFATQTVPIGKKTVFNITMKEDNMLTEVVITSRQTMSDGTFNIPLKETPFAMQKINTKAFEGIQVAGIDDALQGRISGLDIVGSGEVGKASSMRIRGTSSINSNTEPLIVMNNIPIEVNLTPNFDFATANQEQFADLLSINPEDIESITVLKDAASTAVWGSRGANGVLMISTKKGVKGPTRVSYTYRLLGAVQPAGTKMLSGDDYTMLMKQAYFNPQQNNLASNIREFNYDPSFSEYPYYSTNTNWRDEVIQNGVTNDHYLVISGGGDKARFRIGSGYYTQKGTVIGQGLERITSRMDLNYDVSSRIHFISEFAFTYSKNERNWRDERNDNNKMSILDIAYKKMPNLAAYRKDLSGNNLDAYYNILPPEEGTESLPSYQLNLRNPVALAKLAKNDLNTYNIQPTLRLQYDLLDPAKQTLRYEAWVSFAMKNEKTHKFLPKEVTTATWSDDNINRSDDYDYESFGIQSENNLTWVPKMANEDHNLMMYSSLYISSGKNNSQSIITFGLPSSRITDASAEGYLGDIGTGIGQWRSIGIVGRVHYGYKSKYMIDFTVRRDGNTRFGQGNKWGNFPGISLRWNISDEAFMDFSNNWLDILAVRGSWGISGNVPEREYMHFSRYATYSSYNGSPTIRPENIRLSNLKWEKTTDRNIGFNLALKDYTYTLDMDIYRRRTEDLLFKDKAIPSSSGYTQLSYRNGGAMDNNGWELNFSANQFVKIGNVSFDAFLNLANSVNKLVSLDPDILASYNQDFSYNNGEYLQRIQEGNAYGSIYGFRYKGVYSYNIGNYEKGSAPVVRNADGDIVYGANGSPLPMYYNYGLNGKNYLFQGGDAIYEDINNDGSIDELDIVYLGNSNPKINGGLGLTLRWKQFSCKIFTNFRYGNKVVNKARMWAENMYDGYNQSIAVNYRWRKEGDPTDMPRALHQYGYNWLASDRYVEDGSFLRLKYVTLAYAIPPEALKKFHVKQMNFYLTLNNLYCFTNYTGVDPEVNYGSLGISEDKSTTPRSRDFTLGVTLGF